MKIHSTRTRLLASSMICGVAALAFGGGAFAQVVNSPTAPDAAGPTNASQTGGGPSAQESAPAAEELVVTGSRIPRPNLTSTSPLQVVSDQEARLQGTVNVETLLQSLPSVTPEFNQGSDNGASGTATVSLRGLNSVRTLVLVDGKRLMPGDPFVPAADLNNIPVALLDRIEVVTGGASAVYGSDAVAGVVNFIMKKNFSGVRIDAQLGGAQHTNNNDEERARLVQYNIAPPNEHVWDGATYNVTGVIGVNSPDGRGNVTAYGSYIHLDPVTQGARDYGACSIATINAATGGSNNAHACQGSSNSAYGRFFNFNVADNPNGTNTFVPYNGAYAFNYAPYNYYQRSDERYLAGYFAHYEVNKAADVYSNFMFADDDTVGQAAPSGLFGNSGPIYQINCANPLAGAAQLALLCGANAGNPNVLSPGQTIGYRFANIPRETELQHQSYRLIFGMRGDLGHSWSYDLYGQYGRTHFLSTSTGDVSTSRINEALNVVQGPTGPVCVSGNPACVPLDIFHALGTGITPAAFNFLSEPTFVVGSTTEQVVSANLTGDLGTYGVKSPWATEGVGVNVGAEYRREHLDRQADAASSSGDLSGAGGASTPINGNFDVAEAFGELRVPLIQDMPLVHELTAELGFRYSDYSTAGTAKTYKVSLEYAPTPDIRFRGGYNRAVRAPNVIELFTARNVQLGSFQDACSGPTPSATLAQCLNTGLTAAQYGNIIECPAGQCNQQVGGNTALTPEKADTYTVGVVLTPRFLHGFNMTLDYYDIKISNAIQAVSANITQAQCLTTGNPLFCNLIHRSPDGLLFSDAGYIIATNQNAGSIHTKGFDLEANYAISFSDMGLGNLGGLAVNYEGSYTSKFSVEPVKGLGNYDCTGYYGPNCGQPIGRYRHKLRLTYTTPFNLAISGAWRYGSSTKLDLNTNDPFFGGGGVNDVIDRKAPSVSYFDLSAQWRVRDHYTVRAGVQNLFDKDPPIFDANSYPITGAPFGNGNTYPGVYDTLGRTLFVGITADF